MSSSTSLLLRRGLCAACRCRGRLRHLTTTATADSEGAATEGTSPLALPSATPTVYEAHTRFVYRGPEGVDPAKTSYVLFPGQASQFVGMGGRLLQYPRAREVYEHASALLKYDLLKLCMHGPERQLALTQYSQPAIFVTSMAALLALEATHPEAVPNCVGTAGYSVGELAAFTFAGAFSFEEGLRLVQVRGQAMQAACDQTPGGMVACTLAADSNVGIAMKSARDHCRDKLGLERPVCEVASHLYAKCVVVAGHKETMQYLQQHHAKFGITDCKPLQVAGAFHTDLMYPAAKTLSRALFRCTIRVPRIPVYSNVAVKPPKTPEGIARLLVKQVHSPVKWHQIIMALTRRGPDTPHPQVFEVGPGQQLGYMLRMVNNKAYARYASVPV